MTLLRLPIIAIAAALLLCCCADRRGADAILDHADTLLFSAPADAVALLDSLPHADLDDARAARRAVLLAKARSKAYQPISPDSSLIAAVNHYEGSDDSLAVQALFYLGEANTLVEDYPRALVNLHDAYELAIKNNETFYAAMAARELAINYDGAMMPAEELHWALRARELFKKAGKNEHQAWMIRNIVNALIYNDRLADADSVSKEADTTLYIESQAYRREVIRARINVLSKYDDYKQVLKLYDLLNKEGGLESHDICNISMLYYEKGDFGKSDSTLRVARSKMNNLKDTLYTMYISTLLQAEKGDYKQAYGECMDWTIKMNNASHPKITTPATYLLGQHYKFRQEKEAIKAADERSRFIMIALLLTVVLCVAILALYVMSIKLKLKKNEADTLFLRVSHMSDEIKNLNNIPPLMQTKIDELFSTHFSIMDELCRTWFKYSGNGREYILKDKLVDELHKMQNQEFVNEIERLANKYYDNWAERFKETFKSIQPRQYNLALYLKAGLSIDSIAILMGKDTCDAIYTLRSRLRGLIRNEDPQHATEWLHDLNL